MSTRPRRRRRGEPDRSSYSRPLLEPLEPRVLLDGGAPIPGDANGDGKVDRADLAIMLEHDDPLGVNANDFSTGDFNGDGKVNGADLAVWQRNYDPLGRAAAPEAGDIHPLDIPATPGKPDLIDADDSGISNTDNLTNVTTPRVQVDSTAPGATVRIYRSGVYLGDATLVSGTTYEYQFAPGQLAEGANPLTARTWDGVAESANSAVLTITLDTTPPDVLYEAAGVGPCYPYDVAVSGSRAVVSGTGLQVFDLSIPTRPRLLPGSGKLGMGSADAVEMVGSVVYCASYPEGLFIYDVSGEFPLLLGRYDTPGTSLAVDVVGTIAYIVDGGTPAGLYALDVSDLHHPQLIGSDTSGILVGPGAVEVAGGRGYVADGTRGVRIFDVSDPTAMTFLGNYDSPGTARRVAVVGSLLYVADGTSGLQIVDVSDPSAPVRLAGYDTAGDSYDVKVIGFYAYLADYNKGLAIVDISDPAAPTLAGSYAATTDWATGIDVSGGLAYLANHWAGLYVFDVTTPTAPALAGEWHQTGGPGKLTLDGTRVYSANGPFNGDFRIIDVTDPAVPKELGFYVTPGTANEARVVGNLAYVADGTAGLLILDVSNPYAPAFVGRYDTPDTASGVDVVGDFAYVADGTTGLLILDVSTPSAPVLKGNYDSPGSAYAVRVVGTYAYLTDGYYGLRIVNVANPASPALVGTCDTPGSPGDVEIVGSLAFVADGGSGLRIIDIATPTAPVSVGSYDTAGYAREVAVVGGYAFVADSTSNQLLLIDVRTPTAPVLKQTFTDSSYVYGVAANDGSAFILGFNNFYTVNWKSPAIDLQAASDTGASNTDNRTCDSTPTFDIAGGAPYVRIYRDGVLVSGEYETGPVTLGAQPVGTHEFTARTVDAAGNVSELSAPLSVTFLAPGDANEDGKVNGADLALWQQHYDPLGSNPLNCFGWGDWNLDGKINGADLALWQQNYNPLGV